MRLTRRITLAVREDRRDVRGVLVLDGFLLSTHSHQSSSARGRGSPAVPCHFDSAVAAVCIPRSDPSPLHRSPPAAKILRRACLTNKQAVRFRRSDK